MKQNSIKEQFKIFDSQPNLVYLDSTATSLKPVAVVEKLAEYYNEYSANIFRGVYKISEKATEEYEKTRQLVADFIGAPDSEIIFTRNATESINLIAYSLGRKIVTEDSEIVTSVMEHHSNFVPWQVLCSEVGASFKIIDINDRGFLDLDLENLKSQSSNVKSESKISKLLETVIGKKTKILTLTYVSNVLGTINPIKEIITAAKKINPKIITIVDAAQAVPHMKVDVNDLGCDFLVFSAHKMLGPTGVGVLWGKEEILKEMYPFMYGGEMISEVHLDRSRYKEPPHKFEAGTPAIGEVIAFKEAIKFLTEIGMEQVRNHELKLALQCFKTLKSEFGDKIRIFGPDDLNQRGGLITFNYGKYHPHDVASILDDEGVCVRAGHHCAMPLHERLGLEATVRASFYIYNDENDIVKLIKGLKRAEKMLGKS